MKSQAFKSLSLLGLLGVSLLLSVAIVGPSLERNSMLASADKKRDILFLKGKFILKDKKGSIVIADEKKCHCPHYYR